MKQQWKSGEEEINHAIYDQVLNDQNHLLQKISS